MALGNTSKYEGRVKKKTRQGCGQYSKGMKKYRGQGGPKKRCKLPKK
jgi:hypothetical protein